MRLALVGSVMRQKCLKYLNDMRAGGGGGSEGEFGRRTPCVCVPGGSMSKGVLFPIHCDPLPIFTKSWVFLASVRAHPVLMQYNMWALEFPGSYLCEGKLLPDVETQWVHHV